MSSWRTPSRRGAPPPGLVCQELAKTMGPQLRPQRLMDEVPSELASGHNMMWWPVSRTHTTHKDHPQERGALVPLSPRGGGPGEAATPVIWLWLIWFLGSGTCFSRMMHHVIDKKGPNGITQNENTTPSKIVDYSRHLNLDLAKATVASLNNSSRRSLILLHWSTSAIALYDPTRREHQTLKATPL